MTIITDIFSIRHQWKMLANRFVLLAALINTFLFNGALYSFIASNLDLTTLSGLSIAVSVFVLVFIVNLIFISLIVIIIPILVKPFLILTAMINSFALYYMVTYQIILDKTMMGNIFNTRSSEAFELITPTLLLYLILIGIIPSWLIIKTRIKSINRGKIVTQLLIFMALGIYFLYINSSSWLWIDKHSKLLGGKILPWSYIFNTARYYSINLKSSDNQVLLPEGKFLNEKKTVVVLIIGETARAHNFHLYGYPRNTNPLLETAGVLTFKNTSSCTTYTTGSLACMLSYNSREKNAEPLPSYLTRLGVDVVWRTNNWGEPPINVTDYQKGSELRKDCIGEGCHFDDVLLSGLSQRIQSSNKPKILIVLHTKGSHGPSYYSRYPPQFEKFTPVCRYEEISKCTQQALINAYDNTILYTDYFLYKTIKILEKLKGIPVMLIYISDHGESLGEQGLYLHGTPYMFAPDFQKKIPFLIWMSNDFTKLKGIKDIHQDDQYSHSNIFHTIIGAFDIETKIYDRNLDVLH